MITVDDKVNIFKNRVLDVRMDALEKLKKELSHKEAEILDKEKKELLEEQDAYEKILIKSHLEDQEKRLTNAKNKKNQMIYKKREEILKKLKEETESRIVAFLHTKAYEDYILKLLEDHVFQLKEMAPLRLYQNSKISKDLSLNIKTFFEEHGIPFFGQEEDERISLGGVIIYDEKKHVRLDFSISQVFANQNSFMLKLIKIQIEEGGQPC